MNVIRHAAGTTPAALPPIDITTDFCPCGAVYTTRNGNPDRKLYDTWCNHHEPHWETR